MLYLPSVIHMSSACTVAHVYVLHAASGCSSATQFEHVCRHKGARAAAAEGILAAADSSVLSRGAADPFGAPSLDEGAVNSEAAEVGLLAAERLTALVVYNAGSAVSPAMKVREASAHCPATIPFQRTPVEQISLGAEKGTQSTGGSV